MADASDNEALLRQIAVDVATTRTNVSNLTELFHDYRVQIQGSIGGLDARIDRMDLRIDGIDNRLQVVEKEQGNDNAVRRFGKWALGTVIAAFGAATAAIGVYRATGHS